MIRLRPMLAGEFADYLAYFIPDYAAEISANYGQDMDSALATAQQDVESSFPQGVDTPGQDIFCIVGDDDTAPLGYLWCKPDADGPCIFISDFCILPAHRGKGHAKAALSALEDIYAGMGHSEVRLRVAADNDIAQRLYLSAGFAPTGINMRKPFGRPAKSRS
ncbi:GNAT family N-acetyltransferase [Hyphomonas jannaschiana]|uniref:Acetyltransferase protein n=1 Tax=Hyphomonas jannaschiana VP2 TaxID=1280952 RepID=A0A059FG72_9PROT|nr:GNAT family N-acetyltransferase [Hyphomonas jannaschiana]KCZ89629.1 acetyltransferase protein [Hyphomonas jannaschiana VP2]